MRLPHDEALRRLTAADHGVLATAHPDRGADAVPAVFAVVGLHLAVPVDTVKPKSSTALRRTRNLAIDPRATFLVEHWDATDWTRLWWVRAELHHLPGEGDLGSPTPTTEGLAAALVARYPQYADRPFTELLVFEILALSAWSGEP